MKHGNCWGACSVGWSLVVIQSALGNAADCLGVQFAGGEPARQEFRVPSAVGPVRKAEVAPRADSPMAIAAVDRLDRRAIGPGEILVEGGCAAQRFEGSYVVTVLPVESNTAHGQIVVAGSR